jgi:hypothetical protein
VTRANVNRAMSDLAAKDLSVNDEKTGGWKVK